MSQNKKNSKKQNNSNSKGRADRGGWGSNFIGTFAIFVVLIIVYVLISSNTKTPETVSLSQIASDISTNKVKEIKVEGNDLSITYIDGTEKTAKKEFESSLSESLKNYGVSDDSLEKVNITVGEEGGALYWLYNLAPFILPLIMIIFFIWYLSRQVKGAGIQALSFGQSKARMTSPDDGKQRITFADVAGAKEAKQELGEVVDFLKNPKKFLDIGARIPKGILLMGAPGTGKCVTGNTLISTSKGLIAIEDVPKYFSVNNDNTVEGLGIITLNEYEGIFKSAQASHWYCLGEQDTYSLKTDAGLSIEGTPEHPVIVLDNESGHFKFKKLGEIQPGDTLAVGTNMQIFGNYTKVPNAEAAYMLGVLTGDGCLTIKDRIMFSSADKEVIHKMQNSTQALFGLQFNKTSSRSYDYELKNIEAKKTLLSWGLQETYARHKQVPEWIRLAPKEYITAYLQGLFDTDGTVEKKGSVSFSSASEVLVKEVQLMLLNLGIVARSYTRKKNYNGQLQSYIVIYGDFVEQFKKEVGFSIERKQTGLLKICEKQRNTNINLIPSQQNVIKKVWYEAVQMSGLTFDRAFYSRSLYKNVKRYMSGDRVPSMRGMTTFIEQVVTLAPSLVVLPEVSHLKTLSSGTFFFTKVTSKAQGVGVVYDLTVPVTHNFLANGIINHNTLLARAVAGEANVAFFSISGSEFVEMFVGVGASRVRDLFKVAKQTSPAIIFIDEIDAVGRIRGTGMGGGNDEREQTLNQILVEMDGFEPNEKVIVMAATNRPDVLDPALLRPGRFDRRVTIDLPDRQDREDILKIHAKEKPFAEDVDLVLIAERTPGFSGADLYSLMNEGAILAARENRTKVGQFDLIRSIEKVMLGPERKSHILSTKEKELTAFHEAGHAIIASVLEYADPVHKVSIISRGRAAGYTLKLPIDERKLQSKKEFLDDIAVSLGGYVVEKNIFNDLTTGSSNDLQVSTALARDMVTKYGMSDVIGPLALEGSGGRTIGGGRGVEGEYSEEISKKIDAEVSHIMENARDIAWKTVQDHRKALDAIAKRLIEVETIEREEFDDLLVANGIVPKKQGVKNM